MDIPISPPPVFSSALHVQLFDALAELLSPPCLWEQVKECKLKKKNNEEEEKKKKKKKKV